jgi:hypothetical protein
MLGSIFKAKFHKDPVVMTLKEIEFNAIKKVSFLSYAKNIVSKRGNIFKNRSYDIDDRFMTKLTSYSS